MSPGLHDDRAGRPAPAVVQFRVDTLTTDYTFVEGETCFEDADKTAHGAAHGVWVAWGDFAVNYGRTRGALSWRTSLFRGKATWHGVEVTAGAVACATMTPSDVCDAMLELAEQWGTVDGAKLKRIDIAADVANWPVSGIDPDAFVINARVAKARAGDGGIQDWWKGGTCTGYTVAPGNGLKLNVYDKLAELRNPASEHKAELEFAAWLANGWDGTSPVTRVEAQMRTGPARELGFSVSPRLGEDGISDGIDPAWAYVTQKWCKVVDTRSATRRTRCHLDLGWLAVQGAHFRQHALPVRRIRPRPGPTAPAALGNMRALLAAHGLLPSTATPEAYAAAAAELIGAQLGARFEDPEAYAEYLAERHETARVLYKRG